MRPAVCVATAAVTSVLVLAGCSSSFTVPYKDTRVIGALGLCDKDGKAVTHGKVTDRPMAFRAVGATAAPAGYDGAGRSATLFAYQPRKGVDAPYWSGEQLSGTSRYSNAAHPMIEFLERDQPLATVIADFPPQWKGLLQLRLYVGGTGLTPKTDAYDALDIRVDGSSWTAVNPQSVACTDGDAVSNGRFLPNPKESTQ